jgi:hypothetical protein
MTLETVNQADQQLAAAFLRMTTAHDQLNIPESDDGAVDWHTVIAQIDALGEATHALMVLARDTMIPALRAAKTSAQFALSEIDTLERQIAGALRSASPTPVRPTSPTPAATEPAPGPLVLIPERRPASAPARARVQCHGTAYDRDANGQKIGPPRPCRNMAPAADPYCHNHGWQKP